MKSLYELKLNEIRYWKKNKQQIFARDEIDSFTLYLDKLGNPKSIPKSRGSYYIDLISGRIISIIEEDNYIIIYPSGIKVNKSSLVKNNKLLDKVVEVVNKDIDKYMAISEDILYYTCFCNSIFLWEQISEIPLELVEQEIIKVKKEYEDGKDRATRKRVLK